MTLTGALFEEVLGCSFLFCFAIRLKLLAIEEGDELGITCPPDRVPQTPAGGLRPPAPPAQRLRSGEPCPGRRTASPAECLSSVSQFCANGEVTSSYQGFSNCRGNILVQAGRLRRP